MGRCFAGRGGVVLLWDERCRQSVRGEEGKDGGGGGPATLPEGPAAVWLTVFFKV